MSMLLPANGILAISHDAEDGSFSTLRTETSAGIMELVES
jgi:hypothetical protein